MCPTKVAGKPKESCKDAKEKVRTVSAGISHFIIPLPTKGEIAKNSGLELNTDPGACHGMTAGYALEPYHPHHDQTQAPEGSKDL